MSSTDPERHLLRGGKQSAVRPLSSATGMTRIGLVERALAKGDRVRIAGAPAAEGFVYVLAGAGTISTAGQRESIAAGDFLGLDTGEEVTVENEHPDPLRLLIGFSEGGAGAIRFPS